jgi:glycosyltransferase involved in cell wall biosynthesis
MLKILFPFVGDSVGGSHQSIIELQKELNKSNISSFIVVHKRGPLTLMLDDVNIKYIYFPINKLAGESPNFFSIMHAIITNFIVINQFIKNHGITMVHGNDLRVNLTWSLPTRLSKAFYLWHQRSLMSPSIFWKFSIILADHFVTISRYVHQSLPSNISESKKTLILNPFNTEKYYEQGSSKRWLEKLYSVPKNDILFGYIGRLVDWKNVDFLIKGFAEYAKKSSLLMHLIIVGTGDSKYMSTLKQLVRQLGVNNIVTFSGFNAEPNRVVSAFDLMVAPSNNEPFGRTLIEAMMQKTPVLASRGGGHSEIINDGSTGRLYVHNNIEDFINQCDSYLNDNKSTNEIISKANTLATLKYSSDRHSENIIKIYRQLLAV